MEAVLILVGFIGLIGFGIWCINRVKKIQTRPLAASKPAKTITKAERNELGKSDWVASFEGDPTEGRHFIKRTSYTKLVMKDGSDWGFEGGGIGQHAPKWECACGASGRVHVWHSDFKEAERKALAEATTHVNDHNYAERKMNSGLDRAF